MSGIRGAVVALTGAGSGLGLGLARYFHEQGAQLAIFDVSAQKIEAARGEFGTAIVAEQGDVRDAASLTRFHDTTVAKFGGVDALIGAQGIWDGYRRIGDLSAEQIANIFDEVMHVNVLGYILSAKIFRQSLAQRRGAIVFTGSAISSIAADGGGLFYTASKHAVAGVVRQLGFEFAPEVCVNAVAPFGIAHSDMRSPEAVGAGNESQGDFPKEGFLATMKKLTLLEHLPSGEEYGPLYEALAVPGGRIMTGQMIMADQGLANRPFIHAG